MSRKEAGIFLRNACLLISGRRNGERMEKMGQITVEICCGSYYDALEAAAGGAERIELNSALALGGLTPSMAELLLVKRETPLKVIAMARPRGAGFCYGVSDFKQMFFVC